MSLRVVASAGAALLAAQVVRSEAKFHEDKRARPVDVELHQLAHLVSGQGSSTLVFLHGWPDDPALFHATVDHFKGRYRCVNVCLPGYEPPFGYIPACLPERTYGFDMDEAALLLYATIKKTCANGEHVTLVLHDWGCVVGYLLVCQYKVDRLVTLDVGWFADLFQKPSLSEIPGRLSGIPGKLAGAAAVIAYQGLLNLFFLMPPVIGDALTSLESKILARYPAAGAGPVVASMNWPYRSMWRSIATWNPNVISRLNNLQPVNCPWLFIYGTDLPEFLRFQDPGFLRRVEQSCPGISKSEGMPGNHWFMNNPALFPQYISTVDKFLENTEAHMLAKPSTRLAPVVPLEAKL